jgi:hypothetical protein
MDRHSLDSFRFGRQHSPGLAKAQGPKMQGHLHKIAKWQFRQTVTADNATQSKISAA